MHRCIVLQWMRWCGKSSLAKVLADQLQRVYLDLDQEISRVLGMSIKQYVHTYWRDNFRQKETDILKSVFPLSQSMIIALGGGTIICPTNQSILNYHADQVIHIHTPLDHIAQRIAKEKNTHRPSLSGKPIIEELQEIYDQRKDIYRTCCHYIIDNTKTIDQTISEFLQKIHTSSICVPISNYQTQDIYTPIAQEKAIQYIELRADLLGDNAALDNRIQNAPRKTIVTNRHSNEWGSFVWSWQQSCDILIQASKAWARAVDIEAQAPPAYITHLQKHKAPGTQLIVSSHYFDDARQEKDVRKTIDTITTYTDAIIKCACMISSDTQLQALYTIEKYTRTQYPWRSYILIGMGEFGKETRLIIPQRWWFLTFVARWNHSTAPGQRQYEAMKKALYG